MIKSLPLIMVCASLTGIIEAVMFAFLAFNTYDKTDDPVLGLPFLIIITYYGSMFISSLGQCNRCFSHSAYLSGSTKRRGVCTNFLIFSIFGTLIVIGALADNDYFGGSWLDFFRDFTLYSLVGFALGIT
jgi:hypothetical protein